MDCLNITIEQNPFQQVTRSKHIGPHSTGKHLGAVIAIQVHAAHTEWLYVCNIILCVIVCNC